MSTTHDKTKRMPAVGSSTSGGPFLPAPAYAMPIDRLLSAAGGVSVEHGLPTVEVQKRYQQFGANQLAEAPPVPTWRKLVAQFKDLVIWILIVAAVIAGAMGEWVDTAAILAIVLVNGIIGFLQEEKAGRALAALQKLSSPMAKVIRDGVLQSGARSRVGAGGPHRTGSGRQHSGRRAIAQRLWHPCSGSGVDRRIGSGGQGRRLCVERERAAGRPSQHGLHGDGDGRGKSQCDRRRDRHGAPNWGTSPGCCNAPQPEPTPLQRRLAELGKVLVIRLPGHRGRHLLAATGAGRRVAGDAVDLRQSGGRGRAGRTARRGDVDARVGPAAHGQTERAGPQAAERRDARLGDRDLLGQDGDVDAQRNDRARDRRRRRTISSDWRRLRTARTVPEMPRSGIIASRAGQSARRVRPHPSIDHGRALQQRDGQPARRRCRLLASHRRSDRGGAGRGRAQGGHRSSRPRTARPLRDSVRLGTQDDVSRAGRVERHSRHAFQRCAGGDPRKVHRRATRRSSRAAHR